MRAIKPGERGRIAVLFWSGRGQVSKQTARDLVFRTRMDTIRSWFDFSFEVTDESWSGSGRNPMTHSFHTLTIERAADSYVRSRGSRVPVHCAGDPREP